MKFTSIIYQLGLKTYGMLPFKKQICQLVRASGIPNERFYGDMKFSGEFDVPVNDGLKFKLVHHKSLIENEVFWKGLYNSWESDTLWIFAELAKTSNVILDIGANTGLYSILGKALNPAAEIYAFEPVKRTYDKMLKSIAVNNFKIHTELAALSNKTGRQLFYDIEEEYQQSASLNPDKIKNVPNHGEVMVEYEIETWTLDDYIENKKLPGIDLVKIDVELHEPQVIEGFSKYLSIYKPFIIIEVLNDEVAQKLNKVFANPAYRIFHLEEKEVLLPREKFEAVNLQWNYLVCPVNSVSRIEKFIRN